MSMSRTVRTNFFIRYTKFSLDVASIHNVQYR